MLENKVGLDLYFLPSHLDLTKCFFSHLKNRPVSLMVIKLKINIYKEITALPEKLKDNGFLKKGSYRWIDLTVLDP